MGMDRCLSWFIIMTNGERSSCPPRHRHCFAPLAMTAMSLPYAEFHHQRPRFLDLLVEHHHAHRDHQPDALGNVHARVETDRMDARAFEPPAQQFSLDPVRQADEFDERHQASPAIRSEEHTSELTSLMRISYAVFYW